MKIIPVFALLLSLCGVAFAGRTSRQTSSFPQSILQQTRHGLPENWGAFQGQPIPAHYSFSTNHSEITAEQLDEALHAIPSIFIATDPANLFSPDKGIYLHPTGRGKEWERIATVTLVDPAGQTNFQVNCGLRIHGGMSRRPEESPKHSFRLSFRREYGPAKLRAKIFGANGLTEFDELVLHSGGEDSWLSSDGGQRAHATYLRDEWMRRSMESLGHGSARGLFVHLFLNNLYWGIYNLCERPGAAMLGSKLRKAGCDILKGDETESGDRIAWNKMLMLANSGLNDEKRYKEISRLLDVPQFMDYMLLNFYAGNSDWDRSANWYAIRPRNRDGRFRFFIWDAEQILAMEEFQIPDSPDDDSPLTLFQKLSENKNFRSGFAVRADKWLADGGPLSPDASEKRFRALADSIAKAIPIEAARWGSYRRDVHQYETGPFELYTTGEAWQPEVNRISTRYFSRRREALFNQLRERGFMLTLPPARRACP